MNSKTIILKKANVWKENASGIPKILVLVIRHAVT